MLFFSSLSLIAAEDFKDLYHIIAYYSFDIKGSSREKIIREMIVPPQGDMPFSSEEELVRALEYKRNVLNNLRLFEEVSYTYEAVHADATAIRYRVKFFIDDAFTFFAIPYPKYDSNYGFRFGLKAYDKNLFGTFANLYFVMNSTQIDNSWEDYEWFSEIEIKNIIAGDSRITLDAEFEAIQEGPTLKDIIYKANFDWNTIPLAQTSLDLHFDVDDNSETVSDVYDKVVNASLQWNNLPWFKSSLLVKPAFQFRQTGSKSPFDIDNISFYSSVNPIRINGEAYVYSNTLKLKFPHEYIYSNTRLSLLGESIFGMPLSFWISADNYFHMDDQRFYNNTYAVGGSISKTLPFNIPYEGSYSISIKDKFDPSVNAIEHVPLLSTTQHISFGGVNWEGNFRKGFKGAFWGKADYALFSRDWDIKNLSFSVQTELEAYVKVGKRLGFSTQAMGFFSSVPSFDWYSEQSFPTFLPTREISASGLLRGILDDRFVEILGGDAYQKLGAVANFDATLMFVKFKNFAEGFMTGFMDIGIFTKTEPVGSGSNTVNSDDLIFLKTIGVEGYGIMDKFPSYPIRGSLGFNLDDVISHFNGELAFSDIEFELTIGMGLHY